MLPWFLKHWQGFCDREDCELVLKRELGPESEGFGAEDLGYNYRMHPLAAVLALADIENLEQRLSHRRNV